MKNYFINTEAISKWHGKLYLKLCVNLAAKDWNWKKNIVDAKIITDKVEICNEFNKFFTNIGPKLADKINIENKKCFENYLKNRILTSFAFDLVDESIVIKHISILRTKISYGDLYEVT